MERDSYITFACSKSGGVEWYWEESKPDLSTEEATAIGVNLIAGALNKIADALNAIASSASEIGEAIRDKEA